MGLQFGYILIGHTFFLSFVEKVKIVTQFMKVKYQKNVVSLHRET